MSTVSKARVNNKVKTTTVIFLLLFISTFPLISLIACAPAAEEQVEIATCSLDRVIQIAMEHSPECRLQVPGEKGKG